jgi:hypothetical protein
MQQGNCFNAHGEKGPKIKKALLQTAPKNQFAICENLKKIAVET